jgi:Zn-finger nucleic acid-binding protein
MQCPECREPLVIVESEGVELDLCAAGHGTWFDAQELGLLLTGAETGLQDLDSRLAALPDQGAARRCPRCRRRMRQVGLPDVDGPVLDRCPAGDGLWFDAGELRALLAAAGAAQDAALAPLVAYLDGFVSEQEDAA